MARSSLSRRLPVLLLLPCCRLRGREAQWLARQSNAQASVLWTYAVSFPMPHSFHWAAVSSQ